MKLSILKTGSGEITESRMEAAMRRLELAADAALNKPAQGSLNMGDEPVVKAEIDRLKVENQLLRQELLDVSNAHDALKEASNTVAVRLDKTIDDISLVLGQ